MRARLSASQCLLGVGLTIIFASGCSSGSNNTPGSSGGAESVGGTTAAASQTGGSAATGGHAATGGVLGSGGASTVSSQNTGGIVATGGVVGSGGSVAAGGKSTTGGKTGAGGKSATGGGVATGGAQPTGGKSSVSDTGGAVATGGTKAEGGATATGGSKAEGGSKAGGGTTSTGTGVATGGASGGGSSQPTSCPSTVLKSGDSSLTVTVGGQSRAYILHVPSAYKGDTAVPLIVDFHPITGTNTGEESSSPFKAQTDPEGVITAYPQGLNGPIGAAWNVGPCCVANVDDVAFAKAIVTEVEKKACIDTKRVYAVGFSMGGGMSHYLGCKAADVFAAVAPAAFDLLAGSAPAGNADDCKPARPIPVLSFRGTADSTALYNGGLSSVVPNMSITFLGAKACWQKWASINGCTDTPTYPTASGSSWTCSYYKQCQADVQVGVCINTGGHAYGDGKIGWTFLKQFTMP